MATNDKYDRQLRLWGAKGQQALGETHVVLVGASAAGTETLKNLVLPGVGSFCVIDYEFHQAVTSTATNGSNVLRPSIVTKHDASSNFFLPTTAIGRSRAEVASQYLRELNPDVQGTFQSLDATPTAASAVRTTVEWARILRGEQTAHPDMKLLVLASDLEPPVLDALAEACIDESLPLIVVQSYGLIGSVRLQLPGTVALLEPKPTNTPPDLRLRTAFSGLIEMAERIHLPDLDSQEHGHVPYPILLYKAAQQYKATHNGMLPQTFAEKENFKALIKAMSRDLDKEVNFEEAIANAYLAYTERDVLWPIDHDDGHDDVAMDGSGHSAPKNKTTLGRLFAALTKFMEQHNGRPPLNGSIPDVTASTDMYVQLQRVYKEQAEQDVQEMTRLVRQEEAQLADVSEPVTTDQISNFCANVYSIGDMKTRSLKQEYYGFDPGTGTATPDSELVDEWKLALMDPYEDGPIHTPLLWYLGLRACQVFFQRQGRYPGTLGIRSTAGDGKNVDDGADWEADIPSLTKILQEEVVVQYNLVDQQESLLSAENCQQICHELTRYGNAEIHTVASVVGGVASQEAVKIITGQYLPLDNTYVYNGIVSVGGVYKM